jgi:hypothetical protein
MKQDVVIDSGSFGHFFRAGSDDLIVRINGCEPHAGNSDGNMIFTRAESGWTVGRQYRPGALGECRRIANRRGQDGLLCLTYAIFLGEVNTSSDKAKESRVLIESAIEKVDFQAGKAGEMTMTIHAKCRRGAISPDFSAHPFRRFRIDYLFDGQTLSLAPSSRKPKRDYDACVSDRDL